MVTLRAGYPVIQWAGRTGCLRPATIPTLVAAQSAAVRQRQPRFIVQYGHQLCHQHQLARLCWRNDDELPDPNACVDGAKLPVGSDRHCRCYRPDSRFRPPYRAEYRQRLGGSDAHHAVRPVAVVPGIRGISGEPGRDSEYRGLSRGHNAGKRDADFSDGAGCLTGGDQNVGHQWRRLFQRQFSPSL